VRIVLNSNHYVFQIKNSSPGGFLFSIALLLITILFAELSNGDHYNHHQSSPPRPSKPDPIDPTGRGNPGIVIVYKKG